MTISMSSASTPVFVSILKALSKCIGKARAHAEAKKFDPNVLVTVRLAPDMLPFKNQVLIACDSAKGCVARLSGVEAPVYEDNESSLSELEARIAKTIAFIESVPAEKLNGTEEKSISVPRRGFDPMQFTGEAYLKEFALPNFFFHATTAYALLRHNGVDLGKADFLGGGR
ncbi:DUF1993 domain-containing protein [Corallococcus llansteffanensis]|uniref:DUF1993 domain-containing protein n=1 Tax=Corallococcus llansteffanensis TaxID=2316731 RepID=A0A3A8MZZ9_9BACT|nr:DUF1993 domain-containing protein [Corallococcus llansteffanensis]RKH37596.1 DUF1993 domain-containing protein [Corallococcus llansteffanensis]